MAYYSKNNKVVLCGDIGGTTSRLAVVEYSKNKPRVLLTKTHPTKLIHNFSIFVNEALEYAKKEQGLAITDACFAVAGHIEKQKVKLTNAKLSIDAQKLKSQTGLKSTLLINDFEALAYSIPFLSSKGIKKLQSGQSSKKRNKAILGAGTGMGKAVLLLDQNQSLNVLVSEGGRADLPIQTTDENQLAEFIKKRRKKNFLLYEDILSGQGIEDAYSFFQTMKYPSQQPNLPAPTIFATKKANICSREAIKLFVNIFAKCCRNFAIDTMSTGGIYIAGGIASRNPSVFTKTFLSEFNNNEELKKTLKKIPVFIVLNQAASVLGASLAYLKHEQKFSIKKENFYNRLLGLIKK